MNYERLLAPTTHLQGVGDEPQPAYEQAQRRPVRVSSHRGKRDEHSSFPKGLPNAMPVHIKD